MRPGPPRQHAAGRLPFAALLLTTALALIRTTDQPAIGVAMAGTTVDIAPSDVALVVLAVLLLTVCRRELVAACRRQPVLTGAAAAFSLWLLGTALFNGATAFVAGVKVVEYAVIGAGVLALVDDDDRMGRVLDLLLAMTILADIVGLYDYVVHGAGRVESFLGTHDFAALATLPLLTMLVGFFAPHRWSRRTQIVAGVASWIGLTLTAALASLLGLYIGVVVLAVVAWRAKRLALRPVAATLAVLVAVSVPTLLLRHNDLGFLHKWFGKEEKHHAEFASSWSQRLIYLYVGGRVWQAHPIAGTGWYGLLPPREFARFVPDARRAYPDNPPRYFPPVDQPYIPQQTFDQVLFELGLIGEALFLLLLGSSAVIGWRRARARRRFRARLGAARLSRRSRRCARRSRVVRGYPGRGADVAHARTPRRGAPHMKIVHVITRLNLGGAALAVLELAAGQRARGHDAIVVAGTIPAGEESMESVAGDLDVPYIRLAALQRELSPGADVRAVRELRRLIREQRPDVLHTHTAKAGAAGRIAAATARHARPHAVVHEYHGHVLSGYFDSRRERVFRLVERGLAHVTDRLIAVSDEVRDDLVSYGVAPAAKFEVVRYGFDLDARLATAPGARARTRAELGAGPGDFVIGWIGRLTAIKRPLDLIRVVAKLDGALLVLIGDGEDRKQTEALAGSLGVDDRVHLLGYRQDIADWYAGFDAFLLTSANEGTPVVAIEALAAGVPVVATDAGGTSTVVDDGETGMLLPVGDVDGLTQALAELRDDPERRRQLGSRGVGRMRERFSVARMVDDVERVYTGILSP